MKKRMEEKSLHLAARALSAIFRPFYVPTAGFLALFLLTYLRMVPWVYQLIVIGMVYLFTVVFPMLAIYLYHRVNGWTLHQLNDRKKRAVPYVLTITCYIACLLLMYRMGIPRFLSGIIVATLMAIVICAVVNIWWKISTHMAAIGEFIGGFVYFSMLFHYESVGWLCFFILLAGVLGTARLVLHQHTLGEVLAGFCAGLICAVAGISLL